jgi:hypothetical protein
MIQTVTEIPTIQLGSIEKFEIPGNKSNVSIYMAPLYLAIMDAGICGLIYFEYHIMHTQIITQGHGCLA